MRWMAVLLLAGLAWAAGAHDDDHGGAAAEDAGVMVAQEAAPVVDGAVAEDEYGVSLQYDGMTIGLALVGDTLYVAAVATTTGWVAVGFGSDVMDGARILFSYVEADGTVFFAEQEGKGHKHHDVADTVATAHAVSEADGATTLEVALPASFIRDSAGETGIFPMIMAYGNRDSVRPVHRFFKSIELTLG
ncbi:MAG: hypothetical protein OXJ90_29405 [Spirochaetaceae bacterium]|nr:hypothetical protein [Spirochaetaceae bacterium]